MKNNNNKQLAPWKETKWITCSSLLFIIPSGYLFKKKSYNLALLGGVTSLASINFWRDCRLGKRRNADLIISKLACGVGSYYYLINSKTKMDYLIYLTLASSSLKCYTLAKLSQKNWYVYHVLFHMLISSSATFCVYKIPYKK